MVNDTPPTRPKINWIWFIPLIVIALWFFFLVAPGGPPRVTVPYSVFLGQVRADNVKQVRIVGAAINGTFRRAVPGTIATPSPAPAATTSGDAAPAGGDSFTEFSTTFPEAVGDPTLLPLLEEYGVLVDAAAPSGSWLLTILSLAFPLLMVGAIILWSRRRGGLAQSGMLDFMRSSARRYAEDKPRVTFDDVAGAEEAKDGLEQIVDFLKNPEKYHKLGARIPHGVLLVGPPGTGKTLMARAVAGEAEVPFFNINASEFVQMFVGVGAGRVRDLFAQAKQAAPSIIFIDELDAVGRRRGAGVGTTNDEREQTLNQLLSEMDGFDDRQEVIVMAATNRPDVLDPAILRPGRFDRQVTLGLPDREGREDILRIHVRPLPLAPDVDLTQLARATTGMSGADLANLANEAALVAAQEDQPTVDHQDFDEALDTIQLGAERSLLLNDVQRRLVAYHESGHALTAWLLPDADPVNKVSIVPRGQALGVTHQLPEEDQYNLSRQYLLTRLAVMLGGRAAEQVAVGDITTGAENDLAQASRLARRMVTRWGMSELGPISIDADEAQPFLGYELAQGRNYSESLAAKIDQEVHRLLSERGEMARELLSHHREELDRVVELLMEEETLEFDALASLLGPRPQPAADVIGPPGQADADTIGSPIGSDAG